MKYQRERSTTKNSLQSVVKRFLYTILFLGISFTACDETFEARQENTEYFYSIYGYLDATVDTQWLRITQVREVFDPTTDPIDATVTLRDIETNRVIVMNDSLFAPNELVAYWNFWTTEDIEYGATYELTASRSDGIQSSVMITIPPDFPTPVLERLDSGDFVIIEDVDNLADVQAIWKIRDLFRNREYVYSFSHIRDSVQSIPINQTKIRMDGNRDLRLISRRFEDIEIEVLDRQIFVASAGPQWINLYELDENIYTLPEGVSNIENGVGFALGTVTKTIPWQSCFVESNGELVLTGCELEERIK